MLEKSKVKIVTHSGHFHADEIFAVAVLELLLGEDNIEIIRSRDPSIIDQGDYVVDVGGIYDPKTNRFDHHQVGGAGSRENTIPYASFGLVWKEFGEKLCQNREIVEKIDLVLIQWIDATDNGVQITETKITNVYPYDIGLYLNTFTPSWDEEAPDFDKNFLKALAVAKNLLKYEIDKRKNLMKAREIVEEIYNNSIDKRIIIFDKKYPYNGTLSKHPEPLFVVSPRIEGNWSVSAIRDDDNSFVNRRDFPESWVGKKDENLEKITGVSGSVFCHTGRFIAINKTKEGAILMAKKALDS